jgi:SulP family sulfate permease
VLFRVFPLLGQLRAYQWAWLRGDVLAGLASAATLTPQALAYGQQAGLPPVAGLYAVVGAALGFALFTSTRTVAVGPASLTAAATFEVVRGQADGSGARAVALAAALSALAGLVWLVAAALHMAAIAEFLSQPVLLGYLSGTALVVVCGQAEKLVGLQVAGGEAVARLWQVLAGLGRAQVLTAALSVIFILLYVLLRRYLHAVPTPLAVVVIAIVVSVVGHPERHGAALVGPVSGGLPVPALPAVGIQDLWALLPEAVGVVVVTSAETTAATRRGAGGEPFHANRELAAVGTASAVSGVLGGFAPMANTSRTDSARRAGARTQVFQLMVAGLVVGTLLVGGRFIARLPVAALAVVAIFSALKMVDLDALRCIWRGWRYEGLLVLITATGVATFGVRNGLLVAVGLSMWDLVRRAAQPHDAVLEIGSPAQPAHPIGEQEATVDPDVLIYRVDAPVFFANANHVGDRIRSLVSAREPGLRWLILDAEAIFYLDATAGAVLARTTMELRRRGCGFVVARARDAVVQTLRTNSYEQGATRDLPFFPSVREAYAFTRRDTSQT